MAQVGLSDFGNWKDIDGYPSYAVSDQGFVLSKNKMRMLRGCIDSVGYPCLNISHNKVRRHVRVHTLVAEAFLDNPTACKYVDHIDGDKTNNVVENLRWCSNSENQQNRQKASNNTSGYKGVFFHRQAGKWCVQITVDGVCHSCGLYDNIVDAAKAYNSKALELHGEFAKLNVIPESLNE